MADLSDKLGEPIELMNFSNHVVGMTLSNSQPAKLVIADYFNPEFRIHKIVGAPERPKLQVEIVIGNSPKTSFDGGHYVRLFSEEGARAQVAQVSNGGNMLLYLANGSRYIGALDLEKEELLPSLGPITGDRGEYFLQLRNGLIATVEDNSTPVVRTYEVVGTSLKPLDEFHTGAKFTSGLAQDQDNSLLYLIAPQGSYPQATEGIVGVHRIPLDYNGELGEVASLDERFVGKIPKDARGLAAIKKGSEVQGYLISTYGFNRMSADMGEPSKLVYIPKLKE